MILGRTSFWELALLAAGAFALWMFFGLGWYRLDRSPRRPSLFNPLVGGALLIAMILAVPLGAVAARQVFNIQIPPPDGEAMALQDTARLILGSYVAQGMVLALYVRLLLGARRPMNDNRLRVGTAMAVGVGALLLFWPIVSAAMWIASQAAAMIRGEAVDVLAHDTLAMLAVSDRDAWFFLLVFLVVIIAPIIEEVMYRGIVQESLGRIGLGNWSAVIITSVIFTMMHAAVVPPWGLVGLFVLSLSFGWAYEKTGRLAAPIVMHMLFNAGNVIMAIALTHG